MDIISSRETVENGRIDSSSIMLEPNLKGTPSIALVPSKLSDLKDSDEGVRDAHWVAKAIYWQPTYTWEDKLGGETRD